MTRMCKMRLGLALLTTLIWTGCASSPEVTRDQHLERGKKMMAGKDYGRAILEFKSATQAMPRDPEGFYQMGLAGLATGDLRLAVAGFRQAVEIDPKHTNAQLRLAQLMVSASDEKWVEEAETRLHALIETALVTPEMLNSLAEAEIRLGKTANAVQTLERALGEAPKNLRSSILLAQAKALRNDIQGAEEVLKEACKAEPGAAEPRVLLGQFYQSRQRLADAEAEFRKAVSLNAESGLAVAGLARLLNAQGREKEAEEGFKSLTGMKDSAYKYLYGLFLFHGNRRDEAVREFERLAKENPGDRVARTRLVVAYRATGRIKEAQQVLDAALEKSRSDSDALLQRGMMFVAAGNHAGAETDLNMVLRLRPDSAMTHYALARLHQARGASLSYRQEIAEALRLDPGLWVARLELAQELLSKNESKAAAEVLQATPAGQKQLVPVIVMNNWIHWSSGNLAEMRKGIDLGLSMGRSADLLVQDGLWKLRSGNSQTARASLEEALKVNPADLRALSALVQTYSGDKRGAMALQKVKDYAAQQPKEAAVQEFLGTMLMASGDRKQARAAFEGAKAADPKFLRADFSLTQADILDGEYGEAERRLKAVLSSDPANLLARSWLANVTVMRGDYKGAIERFRQVISIDPGNAEALNNLAYLIAEHGNDTTEALKYAQKAQELAPDNAEFRDTLGWVLYRKGLYKLAVAELERAAAAKDGNAIRHYHLAMAYVKVGDPNRARTSLEAGLKRDPNMPEAKIAQQMLNGNAH